MQVKLLRVLQEREVRRVGENRARAINVRSSRTNRDLLAMCMARVPSGSLLSVEVVEITVPSLRQRRDTFCDCGSSSQQPRTIREKTPGFLPGGESAAAVQWQETCANWRMRWSVPRAGADGSHGVDDLPPELGARLDLQTADDVRTLAEVERDYIALRAPQGATGQAAEKLGIGAAPVPETQAGAAG